MKNTTFPTSPSTTFPLLTSSHSFYYPFPSLLPLPQFPAVLTITSYYSPVTFPPFPCRIFSSTLLSLKLLPLSYYPYISLPLLYLLPLSSLPLLPNPSLIYLSYLPTPYFSFSPSSTSTFFPFTSPTFYPLTSPYFA